MSDWKVDSHHERALRCAPHPWLGHDDHGRPSLTAPSPDTSPLWRGALAAPTLRRGLPQALTDRRDRPWTSVPTALAAARSVVSYRLTMKRCVPAELPKFTDATGPCSVSVMVSTMPSP